ncbi:MAG: heparinase II/III family protein [Victivallaceae bacterium]
MKLLQFAVLAVLTAVAVSAAEIPDAEQLVSKIRRDHPRLFLTRETIPALREYAATTAKDARAKLLTRVDALAADPKLELKDEIVEIKDGKLIFKKMLNDQNAGAYGVKTTGGTEALECALAWLFTGNEAYKDKALAYLKLNTAFCAWSDQYKILPEWYHYSRLAAIMAYDILYDQMTPEERKSFMLPMLKHVEHMQNPGYQRNSGGPATGNYGEPGLQWFAGVAALGDGIDDALAKKLLTDGYKLNCEMMDTREKISGGTGLLTSICSGYSFGAYPWASYNFIRTLKSAAGIDAVPIWPQMRDYANWFGWAMIPAGNGEILDYGWGDAFHQTNKMPTGMMYTHLAQAIDLFGDSDPLRAKQARAIQSLLPENERELRGVRDFPFIPFILTNFDPGLKNAEAPEKVLNTELAAHFPTFGLTVMRSGLTPDATYASFRGGATFDQHQHYDENSFVIYKQGFQALDTGSRGSREHHLVYYPQTVAHNAILIRMDDEPLANYWYPANAPKIDRSIIKSDGGQDRTKAARPLGFDANELYAATGSDATRSYNSAKCREAIRQFVYIAPDYFVIYDRVASVKPEQAKVFVLHLQNEPGPLRDGVIRSDAGEGSLFIRPLLPEKPKITVLGGDGKEFWTNGRNWPFLNAETLLAKPNWQGRYRLEIEPAEATAETRFLTVLQAAGKNEKNMVPVKILSEKYSDGVDFVTRDGLLCRVLFNRNGAIGGHIFLSRNGKVLVDKPLLTESMPLGPVPAAVPRKAAAAPSEMARLDLVLSGSGKISGVDRGNAVYWDQPRWFADGRGLVVQFGATRAYDEESFAVKAENDGELALTLRGPDVRNADGKREPHWIEFASLTVNGRELIAGDRPLRVWHDKSCRFNIAVRAGEKIKVDAKFRLTDEPKQ